MLLRNNCRFDSRREHQIQLYILIAIPNQESAIFKNYIKWCNKNNNSYNEEHLEFSLDYLKKILKCAGFKIIDEDGFQIFLSEGRFWIDSKTDIDPLINEMLLYDNDIARDFPNYDFKYDVFDLKNVKTILVDETKNISKKINKLKEDKIL